MIKIVLLFLLFTCYAFAGDFTLSVDNQEFYLNNQRVRILGLRCSNALLNDQTAQDLIDHMDLYAGYGINTMSVFFMGSRFGDIKGYREDASLDTVYAQRMARIIRAADKRGMIVLVGCLYWGGSRAKWPSWGQKEANLAVANTVRWLAQNDFRNVLVDVDNEGMARRKAGFDDVELVRAAQNADSSMIVGANFTGPTPKEADVGLHFCYQAMDKPYIESEGTPSNAPQGYWGRYSKREDYYNYIRIGHYTDEMKKDQIRQTLDHLNRDWGYMLASTWLQCVPPYGPNCDPGGNGSEQQPGIRWWLEFVRDTFGPYFPPARYPDRCVGEEHGKLVLEAEDFQMRTARKRRTHEPVRYWRIEKQKAGYSGHGYVVNLPDYRCETCKDAPRSPRDTGGPELLYRVNISNPGPYKIWVRGFAMGGESNGCHIGVDGLLPENGPGSNMTGFRPVDQWRWENGSKEYAQPAVLELSKGEHTIHLWGRDDGFRCDKILLTLDHQYMPSDTGPPVSRPVDIKNRSGR